MLPVPFCRIVDDTLATWAQVFCWVSVVVMYRRDEMNDGRECHVAAMSHVSAIGNKGADEW